MKKFSLVLVVVLVLMINVVGITYAQQDVVAATSTADEVNQTINKVGDSAMEMAQNILNQATMWSLPFCAILIVFGAVQYFIMGIRNLYKKRQGLLLMFGSMTFYVVILAVDLILAFLIG